METSVIFGNTTTFTPKRQPFISNAQYESFSFINLGVITCIISNIGICANIAIIATFRKLGFKETINISLLALAINDFATLICQLWICLIYIPSINELLSLIVDPAQIPNVIGGRERVYLTITGGCITSIIAFERCLCVMRPLQIKSIFTKKKLLTLMINLLILVCIPFIPLYYVSNAAWRFNPKTNRSILTLNRKDHLQDMESTCFGVIVGLRIMSYLVVTICTVTIVLKLALQSAWRTGTTQEKHAEVSETDDVADGRKGISKSNKRDKRAMQTVITIATVYIVCFLPGTVTLIVMAFVPEFNPGKLYTNLCNTVWTFCNISESICCSVNIIIYFKTSTRFKDAFLDFFRTRL